MIDVLGKMIISTSNFARRSRKSWRILCSASTTFLLFLPPPQSRYRLRNVLMPWARWASSMTMYSEENFFNAGPLSFFFCLLFWRSTWPWIFTAAAKGLSIIREHLSCRRGHATHLISLVLTHELVLLGALALARLNILFSKSFQKMRKHKLV